jgi:hypothetical protein
VDYFRTVKSVSTTLDRFASKDMVLSLETSAAGVDDTYFRFVLSGSVQGGAVQSLRIVLEFDLLLQVYILLLTIRTSINSQHPRSQ